MLEVTICEDFYQNIQIQEKTYLHEINLIYYLIYILT